jgi:hypothetical protein
MSQDYRVELEIPSDPRAVRVVHDEVVSVLDDALARAVPGGQVLHAMDLKRIVSFAFGGPPVWSVGVVSGADGLHQYLTYGLSRALDPAQPFGFELSMRVRSPGAAPMWPTLLLRTIARYHLTSGRVIEPGESLDLGGPISQAPLRPEDRHTMPGTRMDSIFIAAGPALATPHGPVEIRNVVGLDAAERALLECCRSGRFAEELRRVDPSLTVELGSPSVAHNPAFRAAIEEASQREGSDCNALCVPGLTWTDDGSAFQVRIPKESSATLRRRLASRLPFGEGLLVHGTNPGPGTEVLIVPGEALDVSDHDAVRLVLVLPMTSPQVQFLGNDAAVWTLRYA